MKRPPQVFITTKEKTNKLRIDSLSKAIQEAATLSVLEENYKRLKEERLQLFLRPRLLNLNPNNEVWVPGSKKTDLNSIKQSKLRGKRLGLL